MKKNLNFVLKHTPLLYFVLIVVLSVWMCFYNAFAGISLIILSVVVASWLVVNIYKEFMRREKNFMAMPEIKDKFDFTRGVKLAMVAVGTDGKITWWNEAFRRICPKVSMHDGITEHIPAITMDLLCRMEKGEERRIDNADKSYMMLNMPFKGEDADDSAFVLTLSDITQLEKYKKDANDRRTVIAHILIDNYDELLTEEGEDVSYQAEKEIEKLVFDWVKNLGGSVRHIEKDRYLCLFNSGMLDVIKNERFDILEKAKSLGAGSAIEPTLSIGVGMDGEDINEIDSLAKAALDMALGRGGDQAVIKDGNNFSYYGGNSRETEKRTKVKARVKALALVQLIDECDNVILMGHSNADADSFGACVALSCVAMARGKQAKVLLETYDSTVKAILENFEKRGMFINKMQARELIKPKTLVIVCDTHRRTLVASPEILDEAYSVVLIDHHRRSEEFILNTDLLYHEPFASSSCEMVTEMLQYIGRGGINSEIAEAMYAGILIDTNSFIYKTGVRTFEAAAYLKRLGADTLNVRKLLRESLVTYRDKAQIVSDAAIYKDNIAISKVYLASVRQEVVAKAANEILALEGMRAAFVVAPLAENLVSVSGRSYGDVNIQMILEKLGGGGHMLAGAAQLENVDVDEAEIKLRQAIDEYTENR